MAALSEEAFAKSANIFRGLIGPGDTVYVPLGIKLLAMVILWRYEQPRLKGTVKTTSSVPLISKKDDFLI